MARKKHIPQRMCISCRDSQAKKSLIRLVRTPEGVLVDLTGKQAGRGAYLHADPACWKSGLQGKLERALNITISAENMQRIQRDLASRLDDD